MQTRRVEFLSTHLSQKEWLMRKWQRNAIHYPVEIDTAKLMHQHLHFVQVWPDLGLRKSGKSQYKQEFLSQAPRISDIPLSLSTTSKRPLAP